MKVLVSCVDMVPQNIRRQPWYYMNAVATGLAEEGHDVWILTDKASEWPQERKVIVVKGLRSFPFGINSQVGALIERHGFDAVIWSTGLTDFFFLNKIDALKIPVIAVVTSPRYFPGELLSLGKDLAANMEFAGQFLLGPFLSRNRVRKFLSIPNLKAVIFECKETLGRYITDEVDEKKNYVIPPPIPNDFLNILNEVKGENDSDEKDSFKVLYFGPPINLRGIDTLINAMAMVCEKVNNVRLDILSRIEYDGLLWHENRLHERIKRNGLESRVNVVSGLLTPREIVRRIISSDVVCLPFKCVVSDVPIAVLETLAAGTMLVTTDVAGVSEFAEKGRCCVVQPRSYKSLATAIMKVIDNHNVTARGGSDVEGFLDNHNSKQFGQSFDRILREVI